MEREKVKFVTKNSGHTQPQRPMVETPEEILERELSDGVSLSTIDFTFEELPAATPKPSAYAQSSLEKEESLLDLPEVSGRNRKRTFEKGFDEEGALGKFKF